MQKEEEISLINVNVESDRQQPLQNTCSYVSIKSFISCCMLILLILNSAYAITISKDHPTCYKDVLFSSSENVNKWFSNHKEIKNGSLIISSLGLDILAIILAALWTVKGTSWRLIMALILYYSVRIICLTIHQIKIPEGYLWEFPGFYSIFVSYTKSNTLFFSSFLGVTLIIGLEFLKMNYIILFLTSLLLLTYQIILILFLRGGYFIDVISAIVFAHYSFMLMDEFANYLEEKGILKFDSVRKEKLENL